MDYAKLSKLLPCEVNGWDFKINGDGSYSFHSHSPAGEDLWIEHECTSPETALNEIKADIAREYENFDVDEHVDLWAQVRGERGVPGTYEELVDDAHEIEKMLDELADMVATWEVPEETDCTDCPVCGYKDIKVTFEANLGTDAIEGVYRCPRCFFASTKDGINTFWGFSEEERARQRGNIIDEYVRYLDRLYREGGE